MADPRMGYSAEDIQSAWADPEFHTLPETRRIEIMSEMDPRFRGLGGVDRRKIIDRMFQQFAPKPPLEPQRPEMENAAAVALAQSGLPPASAPDMGAIRVQPQDVGYVDVLKPRGNPMRRNPATPAADKTAFPVNNLPQDLRLAAASTPAASSFGINSQTEPIIPATKPTGVIRSIARPGPHVTILPQNEEQEFRQWVAKNQIPFDPGPQSDYDMRGYWKAMRNRDERVAGSDPLNPPAEFQTPYHPEFSNKSIFAGADAPKWMQDKLVDSFGRIIKDKAAEKAAEKMLAQKNVAGMKKPPAPGLAEVTPGMERLGGTPPTVPTPQPQFDPTWQELQQKPGVPEPQTFFDPMSQTNEPWMITDPAQAAQFGMNDPGRILPRQALAGAAGLALDAPGGLASMIGNATGSDVLTQTGEGLSAASRAITEPMAPPPDLPLASRDGWSTALTDPRWWAASAGNGIGSMIPMMATGVASGALIEKAITTGMIRGPLAEMLVQYGPAGFAGVQEGFLAGGNAYNEAKQAGATEEQAREVFAKVAATTAATAVPAFAAGAMNSRLGPIGRTAASQIVEPGQEVLQGRGEDWGKQVYDPTAQFGSQDLENAVGGMFGGAMAAPAEYGAAREEQRRRVSPSMQQEFEGLEREMRGPAPNPPPPGAPPATPPASNQQAPQAAPPAAPTQNPASTPPQQAEIAPQAPPPPPKRTNPMARPAAPAAPTIEEIPADIEGMLAAEDDGSEAPPDQYQTAVEMAKRKGKISPRDLQNELVIGFAEAEELAARLERDGVVGPIESNGVRWLREEDEYNEPPRNVPESKQPTAEVGSQPNPVPVVPEGSGVRSPGNDKGGAVPGVQPANDGVSSTAPEAKPPREFSSTQVNLPPAFAKSVMDAGSRIADEDLTEDGRETEPHATVKFGLHTNDAEDVRAILADEPPIRVKLGKVSLFENEDADVVKIDLDSADLHRLNKKIADALPHTDSHPTYQPHITLGYVKPGKGKKYLGLNALEGQEFTIDAITFSGKDRQKVSIPLGGTSVPSSNAPEPPTGVKPSAPGPGEEVVQPEPVDAAAPVEEEEAPATAPTPTKNPMRKPGSNAGQNTKKHPMSELWAPKPVEPQTALENPIIKEESTNVPSEPAAVSPVDGARPANPKALEGAPSEDVQGSPGAGETPGERVGGAGTDERPVGRTDKREGDESGRGEGNSDAGVGASPERTGQPDDRIRPNLPTGTGTGRDYRISDDDGIGAGGVREKSRLNLEAVRLLKKLETEQRDATPAEQRQLARYVGWGGMSQAFDQYHRDWKGVNEELRNSLTPEEYNSARGSTPNAHYTAPDVIKGMWRALERFGLGKDANVLEPSMGVGHFFGLQPETLLPSRRTGIELDSITGRLAKALYPDASVHVAGFEKVKLPNNYFDLAIGNVPFGDYGVHDPEFKGKPGLTSRIHDFFFAKALNKVRPGGVVAFITSHHTMDKRNSTIRRHLAQQADLVGAIRLPNTTFKGNAGTEVTTDIIFLQKRAPGQPVAGEAWSDLRHIEGKDGQIIDVNEYFANHPEMMLGEMALEGSMYAANTPTLTGVFTSEAMDAAIAKLPENIITPFERPATKATPGKHISMVPEAGTMKDSGYGIVDGKLVQRIGDEIKPAALTGKNADRVKKLIPIRDAARTTLRVQLEDKSDAEVKKAQAQLGAAYDSFVKEFGPISDKPNVRAYAEDPDLPLLLSLEDFDAEKKTAKKTAIFTERTVAKYAPISSAETAAEAMAVSLNEYGRLDWARMQELTGRDPEQLREELGPLVYRSPDGRQWQTAEEYLSGDVRSKLRDAEAAAASDKSYSRNVEALKSVQPVDLKPNEIDARLGASWVPKEVVSLFARETLKAPVSIGHAAGIGAWTVTPGRSGMNSVENSQVYGTNRYSGHELLEMALNSQVPKVYDTYSEHGVTKTVLNEKETIIAQEKQQNIKDRFKEWIWENPSRAETLAQKYNDEFNNLRLRQYDGSHLTFPGMTEVKLRPHQKNAAWRVLQSGNTLLAHVVGAGKTFAMAAAAMELKRVGLAKKPMFVVPNHLVEQWGAEFVRLYPGANVFIAGKEFFSTGKRQRAMTRIASGNFDAIIVSHRSFEKLPVADQTFTDYMQEQVDELVEAIDEMTKAEGGKGRTVKQLEKAKKNLEAKMEKRANNESRDNAITFEELGVDQIFVDEAHMFKNLFFVTKMGRVAGLPQTESNRSFDMFMKTQYLTKRHNGRGVVFATGTPVANSMAELYTMQRYLQMPFLKANGLQAFDAWASNFGEAVAGLELAPEGTGYRMNTRFAKFVNIPELMTGFRMVADVQTADMLNLPRPKLRGGRAQSVTAPETEELKEIVKNLAERAAAVRTGKVDPKKDNMLKITTEGRKAALDLRVLDPNAPDHPDSKINRAVDKIHMIWQNTKKDSLAQVVFMDFSTPKKKDEPGFSAYNEMRRKLVDKGIPEKEIAFIHDAETDADKTTLFSAVNAGRVRIIFGSTEKMGAGTNIQRKLVALHHMDAPWRPADIEQREGRILRQGNTNAEVEIFQYLTQGSFDAYMWQLLGNKAGFISKVMTGDLSVRSAEDVGQMVLSAEEFMAVASGNPAIKEKVGVDAELRKMAAVRTEYNYQQSVMRGDQQRLPLAIESFNAVKKKIQADIVQRDANPDDMRVGKKQFKGDDARKEFAEALDKALRSWKDSAPGQEIGSYRGFKLTTGKSSGSVEGFPDIRTIGPSGKTYDSYFNIGSASGTVQSLEYVIRNLETAAQKEDDHIATAEKKLEALKDEIGKGFDKEERYQQLLKRQKELGELLNINKGEANAAAAPEATPDSDPSEDEDGDDEDSPSIRRPVTRGGNQAGFMAPDFLQTIFGGLAGRIRGNPTQKQTQDYHQFPEANEKAFQAAGRPQDEPKGIMDTLKEAYGDFKALGRVYRHLSRSTFGPVINKMVRLQKAQGIASSRAMISMSKLVHQTGKMTKPEYELLRKSVIVDDLMETVELFAEKGEPLADDHKLAFNFTPATLREEQAKLKTAIADNESVSAALEYRREIWAEIKEEYLDAMKAAGEDVTGKLQRKNYYRHQVLLQKRLEALASSGKLAAPNQRSFLKARDRENVGMDYATNFVETEMKVMTQLMIDTQTAQFVAWLDGKHNIIRDLKEQAKWKNVATVMPYFESMAAEANAQRGPQDDSEPLTGDDMFRRTLNRQQAIAMDELGKLAVNDQLPDTPDGKWAETIAALADRHLAKKAAEDEESFHGDTEAGDVIGYAAWLLRQPEASKASRAAGSLFKGIQAKKTAIKRIAGDKFVTWEDLIPETHKSYQMDPKKAYYSVFTIPEHLALKALEDQAETIGLKAEDIRKVFARGADKDPMILPAEIVKQFEEMQATMAARRAQDNVLVKASQAIMGAWKRYQLISPMRATKYTLRNQSGDLDAIIAGVPWITSAKMANDLLTKHQREVAAYFKPILTGKIHKAELSPGLKTFASFGAFEGLLAVQEIGDPIVPDVLQEFSRWEKGEPEPSTLQRRGPVSAYKGWMRKAEVINNWREAANRYAVYQIFLADIQKNGGKPSSYSSSLKEEVDALETNEEKAYRMSNDLLGAYDEVSRAGQWMRKNLIPFWSYQELNFKRYARLIRNGVREGMTKELVGRMAVGTAARAPYMAYRVASTGVKMYALWALATVLNGLFAGDDDDKLRKEVRLRPHLTFGNTPDGTEIVHFPRIGNISDILEWMDLDEMQDAVKAAWEGRRSWDRAAWDVLRGGPIEKLVNSVGPQVKYPFEAALDKTVYPNIDRPRVIESWPEKISQDLGLGDAFRGLTGRPNRQLNPMQRAADLVIYRADPKESGYYDTLDMKQSWRREQGLPDDGFSSNKPTTEALRNVKKALRYRDQAAFNTYLQKYVELGGDEKGFDASIKRMAPLAGLNKEQQARFIESLSAEDKKRLDLALEYYDEVFTGDTADKYFREYAPK